jgi:hypothetical protein
MVIPYATEYTATLSGSVLKLVPCEHCGAEYVYQLERSAQGSGTSFLFLDNDGAQARASARAEAELRQLLERGVDLVPCPKCGWYQANMLPVARRQAYRGMRNAGLCLLIGVIPLALIGGLINAAAGGAPGGDPAIPWPVFLAGLIVLGLAGAGLLVARVVRSASYDPNAGDVEAHKQLGQSRAMLREEFEKMIQTQAGAKGPPEPGPYPAGGAAPVEVAITASNRCPQCGVINTKKTRYCANCMHDLD